MSKLLLVLAALIAALSLACGGGDDKTVDIPGGGQVSISGDLPDDFPDDFPVYDGADVRGSVNSTQEGAEGYEVIWETGDGVDDVSAFYNDAFEKGPWKSTSTTDLGATGRSYTVENQGDDRLASLIISTADDKTSIIAFIGQEGSASGNGGGGDDATVSPDDPGDGDGSESSPNADLPDEANLPDDFPDERVPLPDGARVTTASSITSGGTKSFIIEVYSEDSVDELAEFFSGALKDKGWTEALKTEAEGDVFATYTSGDPAASQEGVTITITTSDVEGYSVVSMIVNVEDS